MGTRNAEGTSRELPEPGKNGEGKAEPAGDPLPSVFPLPTSDFRVPTSASPLRIRHVDSLRAVAALLVVWAHLADTFEAVTPPGPAWLGFLRTLPRTINAGRMGVMIFFAVSGFVICRSFGGPREGGARRFVIKRFCRLYPAYWASMLGGLWLVWLKGGPVTWPVVAANATMLPRCFGQPDLLGVYWTLEIELLFYGLCLGLDGARCLDRRWLLSACAALLAFTPRLLKIVDHHAGTHLALTNGQPTLVLSLAVMFWGAVFRLVYDETGGFRRGTFTCPGTWLLLGLTLALIDLPDPNIKWFLLGQHPARIPLHLTVVAALGIFLLWVAVLRIDHVVLTYLGVVSYSLYLFHAVVLYTLAHLVVSSPAIGSLGLPFWAWIPVGVSLSIALAALVYRWVERPAIAFGKRWATR